MIEAEDVCRELDITYEDLLEIMDNLDIKFYDYGEGEYLGESDDVPAIMGQIYPYNYAH